MYIPKISLLAILAFTLSACTEPATTPSPPSGATSEEVVAFYSAVCTQRGVPDLTVEQAVAQGDARKAFAHQACIDRLVIDYIRQTQAAA